MLAGKKLRFELLLDVTNNDFKEAIRIYEDSIPAAERQKISLIKERVKSRREYLLIGRFEDEIVSMALIWSLENSKFNLLDYLAVKESHRRKGVGTSLIKYILMEYVTGDRSIVVEVEDPKDRALKNITGRVEFYRKNGAKELKNVPYFVPPLQGNYPNKMILMIFSNNPSTKMESDVVKSLIKQIYLDLYSRDAKDPLLISFITSVPSVVELV